MVAPVTVHRNSTCVRWALHWTGDDGPVGPMRLTDELLPLDGCVVGPVLGTVELGFVVDDVSGRVVVDGAIVVGAGASFFLSSLQAASVATLASITTSTARPRMARSYVSSRVWHARVHKLARVGARTGGVARRRPFAEGSGWEERCPASSTWRNAT